MQSEWTRCLDASCFPDPIHQIQEITSHTWEICFCTYVWFPPLLSICPLTFASIWILDSEVLWRQLVRSAIWPTGLIKSWKARELDVNFQNFLFCTCSAQASPDSSECYISVSHHHSWSVVITVYMLTLNGHYWGNMWVGRQQVQVDRARHAQAGCRTLMDKLTNTGYDNGECALVQITVVEGTSM